ncbi:prepilin peptidase-dependent pilin [Martelella alba]|uniref:Prepilin peptidase-dependent pilin n=1 Tax=Martelella alba TaxID=2590451 RepID=A0ABY2SST6_9HYPH|nr:prepilin peptidase-dependent pilin [Martelella alba]TKI08771.1 prepilin peptidase-dependent pilin [Martelella alba]
MNCQQGFTLIELMIVIAIIATLSAIGLPGYQRYIDNAALTDMLQMAGAHKSAVELCALQDDLGRCRSGQQGIPQGLVSRQVAQVDVQAGVIRLTGQRTLAGLTLTLSPFRRADGLNWTRRCESSDPGGRLLKPCQAMFAAGDEEGES